MQVKNIPLADIATSPLNPRKTFDEESLNELAENIKENGLIQPITLRKTEKGNEKKYEIVCGERRYRASIIAGLSEIPSIVRTDLDDKQAFAAMIIENLQRKDVDPIEEAAAFSQLFYGKIMMVKEIAKILGKSSSYVTSRINLANIHPDYVSLLHDGRLYVNNLLEICKLSKEQQETLFNERFTPECIARWKRKYLTIDELKEWIDESVMVYLDTARFSLLDETFSCGKNCEGCPLNTKNKPDEYTEERVRCMNPPCFKKKTMEQIFREAKVSGVPCVYRGNGNEDIIKAAMGEGIFLKDYTKISYVLPPEEPKEENFTDKEVYRTRKQNYDRVKNVFDSNISDGTVESVFEICFSGKLSGEEKFAYHIPNEAKDDDIPSVIETQKKISEAKQNICQYAEQAKSDITEGCRKALAASDYSNDNSIMTAEETKIFHAVMMKFIPQSFKKKLGIEWSNDEVSYAKNSDIINKNRNAIKREFIKTILSEKSVCLSHDLAGMLSELMEAEYQTSYEKIKDEALQKCEKKTSAMEAYIQKLK